MYHVSITQLHRDTAQPQPVLSNGPEAVLWRVLCDDAFRHDAALRDKVNNNNQQQQHQHSVVVAVFCSHLIVQMESGLTPKEEQKTNSDGLGHFRH